MKKKSIKAEKVDEEVITKSETKFVYNMNVPKTLGSLKIKKLKEHSYDVYREKELIASLNLPHKSGDYFMPNYSVWIGVVLQECFSTLDSALTFIKKFYDKKRK